MCVLPLSTYIAYIYLPISVNNKNLLPDDLDYLALGKFVILGYSYTYSLYYLFGLL